MRSLYLPLISFWKAVTGQACFMVGLRVALTVSFLSILARTFLRAQIATTPLAAGANDEAVPHQVPLHHGHEGGLAPGNRPLHRQPRQRSRPEGPRLLSLHEERG